ncbi:MAG: class II glutamine amidotransferase [Microscillaceae bacterium]|nr:class II glutamine amidotransferase [Microscillaceae bacterium]MDW8461756.1 class II glutamine amidotransferase [Cytophagales bacterium]
MCGISFIRLRKPYTYYIEKYKTPMYGLQKLYILMQKQNNRGQDGAGVATLKLNVPPGQRYISRYRSMDENPIEDIFKKITQRIEHALKAHKKEAQDQKWVYENVAFMGEVLLGHLRYGTHGINSLENCHPFLRQSNWRGRNLILAGNFNLTNVDELFDTLVKLGQHPKDKIDTVLVLEKIGHFLDEENQRLFREFREQGLKGEELARAIEQQIDLKKILSRATRDFDGGYAMIGITGYGDAFVARDAHGIRPAFYYANDEVVVVASERPAIRTAFGIEYDQIQEIKPAHALLIDRQGNFKQELFTEPQPVKACSFERIYFSRGTDPAIYAERKNLGRLIAPKILEAINYDLENTVFSYIPNTAETAFLGMIKGIEEYIAQQALEKLRIFKETNDPAIEADLIKLLSTKPRIEKLAIKEVKLRTFITEDEQREDVVSSVYDTTFGVIRKQQDTLVLIDDSIVRGTTLEKSILKMLDRLEPKKIIIVSSAPQIRFPDCYGIDMSKIREFVAFRAVLELLEETQQEHLLDEVYAQCLEAEENNLAETKNYVKRLYDLFSDEQISAKISQMVGQEIHAEIQIIYQSVENLHLACPQHTGDWYFTGDYPTRGGNRVVNQAFINFMQGSFERAY